MIFTAYIDESDTHGDAPDIIMSAFIGSQRQWELFNRRLRAIQKEFGFTVFHATDFKGQKGEFKGWPDEKCQTLIERLTALVRDELTEGIVTQLPYALYKQEHLDKVPRKMARTSQYGICFLATLEQCVRVLIKEKGNHRLSIVIEEGHKNVGDAARVFEERRNRYKQHLGADALRTLTIGSKKNNPELMVSDFLAHTVAMGYRRKAVGMPNYTEMTDAQPRKRESGLTFQEVTPLYLQSLIDEFEADKKAKQEAYLNRKQAWFDEQTGKTLSDNKVA